MAKSEMQRSTPDLAVDRATRIRDYVEQLISLLGEQPECELKRDWARNTPPDLDRTKTRT